MGRTIIMDEDRLFPSDPTQRQIARRLYGEVKDLPIVSPHGHTDPRWYADDVAFSLLAIPFFIMTRQLLGAGGLANRIVDFANVFVGRLPGGLSIVNSVACMFFGNLSGSAVADTSAIGKVSVNAGTKAMMPFFLAMIVVLFLITYYTPFTMWLPGFVK